MSLLDLSPYPSAYARSPLSGPFSFSCSSLCSYNPCTHSNQVIIFSSWGLGWAALLVTDGPEKANERKEGKRALTTPASLGSSFASTTLRPKDAGSPTKAQCHPHKNSSHSTSKAHDARPSLRLAVLTSVLILPFPGHSYKYLRRREYLPPSTDADTHTNS